MFNESIDKAYANQQGTTGRGLLPLLIALFVALTIHPAKAHAEIVGEIEADIPFQFHAGDTKLPAGKYIIRTLDSSDFHIMEISTADGSISALFDVEGTQANSGPAKTELIFNRYGHRYFLEKLFDEGNPDGSKVLESHYEKLINEAAAEGQEHVPAHHRRL